jgi:hypothetical protein
VCCLLTWQAALFVLPAARRRSAGIHPCNLQVEQRTGARTAFAAAALLVVGLAGCAAGLAPGTNQPAAGAAPYVGVFTGEFVDGRPLYRFPAIEVVGSRIRVGPGT